MYSINDGKKNFSTGMTNDKVEESPCNPKIRHPHPNPCTSKC